MQQSHILAVEVYWVYVQIGMQIARGLLLRMMWDQSMIWETSRLVIKERKLVENRFKGRGNLLLVRAVQHVWISNNFVIWRREVWDIHNIFRWKLKFDMRGILGWCHTRSPLLFVQHLNETPVISLLSEDPLAKYEPKKKEGWNKRAKKEFAATAGEDKNGWFLQQKTEYSSLELQKRHF